MLACLFLLDVVSRQFAILNCKESEFGILLFLYYPIFFMDICAFLSKNEQINSHNSSTGLI